MSGKIKTIDEVCGNPPGTFLKSLETNAKNERDMESRRQERIKNRIKLNKNKDKSEY
jgi:hypothetical protein